MAITRTYGNITDALSLADKAGQGDAFRWQFQADSEYQKQLDSEQQQRNQQANAEITNSIHQQDTNQQGTQIANTGAYQQGELGVSQGRTQAELQQAAAAQQRANAYDQMIAPSLANRNNAMGNQQNAMAGVVDPARAAQLQSVANVNNMKTGQETGAPPYAPGNPEFDAANKGIADQQQTYKDSTAALSGTRLEIARMEKSAQDADSRLTTSSMSLNPITKNFDALQNNARYKALLVEEQKGSKYVDDNQTRLSILQGGHNDRLAGKQPQAAAPSGKQVTPEVAKQYADQARKDNPNATPQQISALAKAAAQKDGYTISQ